MGRKQPPPPTIEAKRVTIRVTPTWGCEPVIGWIVGGWLQVASGPPRRSCKVVVGPRNLDTQSADDYEAAIKCIRQRGYTNAWIDFEGTGLAPILP